MWLLGVLVLGLMAGHAYGADFDAVAAYKNESTQKVLKSALDKLMEDHVRVMPLSWIHAGVVYRGGNWRLRRVLVEAAAGRPIHIGLVGGSISCVLENFHNYQQIFARRLQRLFPTVSISHTNGCTAGTGSSLAGACAEAMVQEGAQIVFVEFLLNDGYYKNPDNARVMAMERLVRKLMNFPRRPAVIIMNVMSHGMAFWRNPQPELEAGKLGFWQSGDEQYGMLAQYYGANWLSLRDSCWKTAAVRNSSLTFKSLFNDDFIHPNQRGHELMAEIVMALIQQTLSDLLTRPYTEDDELEWKLPLDPPVFPGNVEPTTATCAFGSAFKGVVQSHEGWEFVNEGKVASKPKYGFVTTTVGVNLTLKVKTTAEGAEATNRLVSIGYLKSYEHMGQARAACVSGCTCEEVLLDGHDAVNHESQTYMGNLMVTPADECIISVTTLPETNSGEHKFKVNGVLVTWDANNPGFALEIPLARYDNE